MKFTCLQEHLSQKLALVNRAVAPKATLSILSNIKISALEDKLKLSATNLSWGITTYLGVQVEEPGELTVPGTLLTSFINTLPPQKLKFHVARGSLRVETAQGWATLRGVTSEEFPHLIEEGGSLVVKLPSRDLHKVLSGVTFAASTDENRPILTGILVSVKERSVSFVGVDGFRLSEYTLKLPTPSQENFDVVLPAKSLQELSRLIASEKDVSFSLLKEESQAVFEVEEAVLASRILEGTFPEYQQIIPSEFGTTALLRINEFRQAIKLASLFAESASHVIRIKILSDKGMVVVGATASEVGTNETSVVGNISGRGGEIAFNSKYLIDILNYFESIGSSDELEMRINDSVSPGYFCLPGNESYLHIIMPVRIQE